MEDADYVRVDANATSENGRQQDATSEAPPSGIKYGLKSAPIHWLEKSEMAVAIMQLVLAVF